ncbi:hypothetical protein [Microvirga antarctica]|uniref:hypothetical protein n=1 Tax=Microvirga antarctica TaxID=2819233 RepID=UPI001B312B29|nr:hypothetical protein [Microvirga antarctica]
MQNSLENIVYSVGEGLVSPGIGSAELAVGLIVGLGFAFTVLRSAVLGSQQLLSHHHHADHRLPERRA